MARHYLPVIAAYMCQYTNFSRVWPPLISLSVSTWPVNSSHSVAHYLSLDGGEVSALLLDSRRH